MKLVGREINEYTMICADDKTSSVAGQELQEYLEKYCGYSKPTSSEKCAGEILIGIAAKGETILPISTLKNDDSFIIKTTESRLFICGKTPEGTLYGVYHFLNLLGIDWLTPEQEYAKVDMEADIRLDIRFDFPAQIRISHNWSMWNERFRVRQRMHHTFGDTNKKEVFGGVKGIEYAFDWGLFGHTFELFLPFEEYYEEHPEYFSFAPGLSPENHQYQICLTNPEVLQIVIDKCLAYLETHPDCKVISVSTNDSYGAYRNNYCMCENCTEIYHKYGDCYSGVLLHFVNQVADAIYEKYPNVLVHTFAYQFTVCPPVGIKPRKNVMVQVCLMHKVNRSMLYSGDDVSELCKERFDKWNAITEKLYVWTYLCNFPFYFAPSANLHSIYEDTTYMLREGAYGLFQQDCNDDFPFEFAHLRTYLVAKLFHNPNMSFEEYEGYIDKFVEGYYGEQSGKYIKKYLYALEELFQNSSTETAIEGDFNRFVEFNNEEYMKTCREYFQKALQFAENDTYRKRITDSKISFDFSELIYLYENINGSEEKLRAYAQKKKELFTYAYSHRNLLIFGEGSRRLDNIEKVDWEAGPFVLDNIEKKIKLNAEEKSAIQYSEANTDESIQDFSFEFTVQKKADALYFDIFVKDKDCSHSGNIDEWCQDSVELFFSETFHKQINLHDGDFKIRVNSAGDYRCSDTKRLVQCETIREESGYRIMLQVGFESKLLTTGKHIGVEIIAHNVGDNGYRNTVYWNGRKGSLMLYYPQVCGRIEFG